jgi:hypothetical protein
MDDPNNTLDADGNVIPKPDSDGQPAGSEPIDVGLDTPLKTPIMGKYKTVGEFQKAYTELQGQVTRANQGKDERTEEQKKDDERPLTVKEFNEINALSAAQAAQTVKFNKVKDDLGISDAQANALAAYGELTQNREKDYRDLAKELGFADEEGNRTEKAKAMGRGEMGIPARRGSGPKQLNEMTEAEMAALPVEEFAKLSNQLNTRVRR